MAAGDSYCDWVCGTGGPVVPPEPVEASWVETPTGRYRPRCFVMSSVVAFAFMAASGGTWAILELLNQCGDGYKVNEIDVIYRHIPAFVFMTTLLTGGIFDAKRRMVSGIIEIIMIGLWASAHVLYVVGAGNYEGVLYDNRAILLLIDGCIAIAYAMTIVMRVYLTQAFDPQRISSGSTGGGNATESAALLKPSSTTAKPVGSLAMM